MDFCVSVTLATMLVEGSHSVEVDQITAVVGATVQGAVVPSESFPSSVEVIGHHIDEVQIPRRSQETLRMKNYQIKLSSKIKTDLKQLPKT